MIYEVRDLITGRVKDKKSGKMNEETIDAGVDDKRLLVRLGPSGHSSPLAAYNESVRLTPSSAAPEAAVAQASSLI